MSYSSTSVTSGGVWINGVKVGGPGATVIGRKVVGGGDEAQWKPEEGVGAPLAADEWHEVPGGGWMRALEDGTCEFRWGQRTVSVHGEKGVRGDMLSGGVLVDVLNGGVLVDILNGGVKADILNGGVRTDILNGGVEADILNGGVEVTACDGKVRKRRS